MEEEATSYRQQGKATGVMHRIELAMSMKTNRSRTYRFSQVQTSANVQRRAS